MDGKVEYRCTDCLSATLDIDRAIHESARHYVECGCGERMMPASEVDLETMDIYDEHES